MSDELPGMEQGQGEFIKANQLPEPRGDWQNKFPEAMNLPPLGPWCIVERLTACVQPESQDTPIRPSRWLALGATAEWVEAKWRRWEGGETEAKRLAALHGGIATPRAYGNPAWHGHREDPHKPRPHQHDRTGEAAA